MKRRFLLSVVLVFSLSLFLGVGVHGFVLGDEYELLAPGVFRSPDNVQDNLVFLLVGHAALAIGLTWLYRNGRTNRHWANQGLRFGLAVGLMAIAPMYLMLYAVEPIPGELIAMRLAFDASVIVALALVVARVNRRAVQMGAPMLADAPSSFLPTIPGPTTIAGAVLPAAPIAAGAAAIAASAADFAEDGAPAAG